MLWPRRYLCRARLFASVPSCQGDGELYPEEERTYVDAAREWIKRYAAERPALQLALADPTLWKRASHVTKLWHRATEVQVAALRHSPSIRSQMALSHAHRTIVDILRAMMTKHEVHACSALATFCVRVV